MPGKACDDCYRKKERCYFDRGVKSCRPCSNQGTRCSFVRQRRRMGRPPTAKSLPYGTCDVITFDSSEFETSSKRPQHAQVQQIQPPAATHHNPNSNTDSADSDKIVEAFTRRFLHPARAKNVLSPEKLCQIQEVLCNKTIFFNHHRYFMVGPSFSYGFQNAILRIIINLHGVLLDAYQSALGVCDTEGNTYKPPSDSDISVSADCLKHLQSALMLSSEDATALVMLGQVLSVYHLNAMGTSPRAITRSSLHITKNWYPTLLNQPELLPVVITPILWDTVECLVRREIPVIRIQVMDFCKADRSIGVSTSLLPILYDLCVISHETLTHNDIQSEESLTLEIEEDPYMRIEHRILQWEPNLPTRLISDFTLLEISAMMMQSRLYRISALLIIHRLRYPLGVEDDAATKLAMAIAAELMSFSKWVPDDMKGICVGFPIFLALLEIEGPNEKLLYEQAPSVFHPKIMEYMGNFIQSVKRLRDDGFPGLWFDMVGQMGDLTVIP